jgi:carbonic anhydrase
MRIAGDRGMLSGMTDQSLLYARILEANARHVAESAGARPAIRPAPRLAVITCMDARIDPLVALGLRLGEAHVIRNAGGLATADAIRSLVISQRLLGTTEVLVIGHTDCGMLSFTDESVRAELARETGSEVHLPLLPFDDLRASVRRQVDAVRAHPWTSDGPVHGLIFDVESGQLREVP